MFRQRKRVPRKIRESKPKKQRGRVVKRAVEMTDAENVRSASMKSAFLTVCGICALAGCSKQAIEAPPPYNVDLSTKGVMSDIIDPAAQILWHSAGTDDTAAGSKNLTPT